MSRWFGSNSRSLAFLASCGFSSLGATACTYGSVADAATGANLPGTSLSFQQVDMSTPVTRYATQVGLFNGVAARTWSPSDPVAHAGYDGVYWLNPYAPERTGDSTPTLVAQGWNRVTLTVSGYEITRIYRNHQYTTGNSVQTNVPYSSGLTPGVMPYPVPAVFTYTGPTASAALESFTMWKTPILIPVPIVPAPIWINNHLKLPDLIVDPRSLLEVQQVLAGCGPAGPVAAERGYCSSMTDDGLTPATQQCLSFSSNFANVGTSNFELYADPGAATSLPPGTLAQQVIYDVAGAHQMVLTTGQLAGGGAGAQTDTLRFAQFDLRGPIVAGVCDTEATASACPIVSMDHGAVGPSPKDVCLGANTHVFDPDLYGGPSPAGVAFLRLTCINSGSLKVSDLGLYAGQAEMYGVGQKCNYLDITNVAPGKYWLEGEVNPADANGHRAYQESDYSNNISRSQVTIRAKDQATCPCSPKNACN
jgi:hypothetical protein